MKELGGKEKETRAQRKVEGEEEREQRRVEDKKGVEASNTCR